VNPDKSGEGVNGEDFPLSLAFLVLFAVTAHILVVNLLTLSDSLTEFFFSLRVFAFFPLRALREKGARFHAKGAK
jgi:hypothetical protein